MRLQPYNPIRPNRIAQAVVANSLTLLNFRTELPLRIDDCGRLNILSLNGSIRYAGDVFTAPLRAGRPPAMFFTYSWNSWNPWNAMVESQKTSE